MNAAVIIVGLGAMGSAAAFHLARRGIKVLALDRFAPPHALGSSHGQTRIIREAYFEHPLYVPLVQRAYQLWAELESEAGQKLLQQTGGLMIGRPGSVLVSGARRSAELHGLKHEILTAEQVQGTFPGLRPEPDMIGVWEPRAGILFPERCIEAHLELARRYGAELRFDEPVTRWEPSSDGVRIQTARGEYSAGQLIVTAGSWVNRLLPDLGLPFTVERQVLFWFEPKADRSVFRPQCCPIHLWQFDENRFFYGFPDLGEGVKVAGHHQGELTTPDEIRREVLPAEVTAMREVLRRFLPQAEGPLRATSVCAYTNTPDQHFWIDWHPHCSKVLIASPCSGHGFKFSSVIGEVLAELAETGRAKFDLSLFRHRRFSQGANSTVPHEAH